MSSSLFSHRELSGIAFLADTLLKPMQKTTMKQLLHSEQVHCGAEIPHSAHKKSEAREGGSATCGKLMLGQSLVRRSIP